MAKRTNKTDHVLSLLGGAGKKQDANEDKAADKKKSQPPVDPLNQQKGNVSVIHASTSEEDPIAGSIRDTLEKEMQEAQLLKEQNSKAEIEFAKELEMSLPEEPETSQQAESEEGLETLLQKTPAESAQKEAGQKQDFEFVNVMERLVRDKVLDYMRQFGNCTCERCVEDTVALTLTNLPAKCVVVSKTAVSPLLNFYTQKYAGHITVEIAKACIVVNANPCH